MRYLVMFTCLFTLGRHMNGSILQPMDWWWWRPQRDVTSLMGGWRTSWVVTALLSTATLTMTRTPGLLLTSGCGSFHQRTLWGTPGKETFTGLTKARQLEMLTVIVSKTLFLDNQKSFFKTWLQGWKLVKTRFLFSFFFLQGLWALCAEKLGVSGVKRWSELVHFIHAHRWWQPQWTRVRPSLKLFFLQSEESTISLWVLRPVCFSTGQRPLGLWTHPKTRSKAGGI